MKAVMLEVPPDLLAERARRGADRRDEMWEGVLHMVPPASGRHQLLSGELFLVLAPLAKASGLMAFVETGLFRPGTDKDYRVPDQTYARPELYDPSRGVDGAAELVVELRSPGDETYDKLAFYADLGVGEVLVVHPEERRVELFASAEGRLSPVPPGADGAVRVQALGVELATVAAGPTLRLTWDGGSADV